MTSSRDPDYRQSMLGGDGQTSGAGYSSYTSDSSSSSSSSLGKLRQHPKRLVAALICVLVIVIFALSFALHVAQQKTADGGPSPPANSSSTGGSGPAPSNLRDLVTLDKLMRHASALQQIASRYGNRYIHQPGFNATVDYILKTLASTNLNVSRAYFNRAGFQVDGDPTLVVQTSSDSIELAYNSDWNTYIFSGSLVNRSVPMTYVANGGCAAADWNAAKPVATQGAFVVVQRVTANCANFVRLVQSSGALGVLVHNGDPTTGLLALEGPTPNSQAWLTATYNMGKLLEVAVTAAPSNAPVTLAIQLRCSYPFSVVTNVCADTLTGEPTSTIVIGSHSDGVIAGAGIVDNGSGTCSNLVWAQAVSQLLSTPGFEPFPNRLRFCWWGAEEQGLLGSRFHIQEANASNEVGMRLIDYALNLNFDMTACPNWVFGVLNGSSGSDFPTTIPASVLPGSVALTNLYAEYFEGNRMPWTGKPFNGRSDYGPFLSAGIPAGGVSAFIDRLKTQEERDLYDRMLGPGMGGIPNVAIDPCYHQRCDTIQNINPFPFEQIGKANGAVLERLARMQPADLKKLMFPQLAEGEERSKYAANEWIVEGEME